MADGLAAYAETLLDTRGLDAVQREFQAGGLFEQGLTALLLQGVGVAKSLAPVGPTGTLVNTIGYAVSREGNALIGDMFVTAEYAPHLEFGTRPHEIRAKNAKALRWVKDGQVHFAKSVQHPGTAPRPFMRPAFNQVFIPNLDRMVQEVIDKVVASA